MTDAELLAIIARLQNTMISVSTGGERIEAVNASFQTDYKVVVDELQKRGIHNSLAYPDLWQWYGRWSSGDLPTYRSRRSYVAEMFNPITNMIRSGRTVPSTDTGWPRVDRTVARVRTALASAITEEEYQSVGLLCREALISLAQAVYVRERHPAPDGITPSSTDAKRQLESYIVTEFSENEHARKFVRSALDLAVALQHKRTARFRDAAACIEATAAVINLIAVTAGRRDP
jgi:hypothetical protein